MFIFSKWLSAITQPMYWLAMWWALALQILTRWRRPAVILLWSELAVLGLLGFQAIPDALLRPLENRYSAPASEPSHGMPASSCWAALSVTSRQFRGTWPSSFR